MLPQPPLGSKAGGCPRAFAHPALRRAEEDLPRVDRGDAQVRRNPRVGGEARLDLGGGGLLDDQQHAAPVAERAPEAHEPVGRQRVHEGGVLGEAVLLAQVTVEVVGPVPMLDDRKSHAATSSPNRPSWWPVASPARLVTVRPTSVMPRSRTNGSAPSSSPQAAPAMADGSAVGSPSGCDRVARE